MGIQFFDAYNPSHNNQAEHITRLLLKAVLSACSAKIKIFDLDATKGVFDFVIFAFTAWNRNATKIKLWKSKNCYQEDLADIPSYSCVSFFHNYCMCFIMQTIRLQEWCFHVDPHNRINEPVNSKNSHNNFSMEFIIVNRSWNFLLSSMTW